MICSVAITREEAFELTGRGSRFSSYGSASGAFE